MAKYEVCRASTVGTVILGVGHILHVCALGRRIGPYSSFKGHHRIRSGSDGLKRSM